MVPHCLKKCSAPVLILLSARFIDTGSLPQEQVTDSFQPKPKVSSPSVLSQSQSADQRSVVSVI